jgi:hypothetical protein
MEKSMIIHAHFKKSKAKKVPKHIQEQNDLWMKNIQSIKTNFSFGNVKVAKPISLTPTQQPRQTKYYPSRVTPGDTCTKPVYGKVYTGDKMLGIGTLHKSNAVPVFRQEEAEEMAKMRR